MKSLTRLACGAIWLTGVGMSALWAQSIAINPGYTSVGVGGTVQYAAADGHLQEPGLFMAGMVRAFGGQMNDRNYYSSDLAAMGQDVFSAPKRV